ncbi:MAG: hypothetical protein QOI84_902 [Solirubrobacterales bacterium]|jgi:hypothetical protein|nr:hypothetical protein [Solirubrobacterales bacterium]
MTETRAAGASEVPIEAKGLAKSYRDRPAVAGIDLTVLPGVSAAFALPPLIAAVVVFNRRDVAT